MSDFKWLNDNSLKILQRGYLHNETDPKKRIMQICQRSEEISGIDGFADKMYNYMSEGWISLASPIWANFGLDRGYPISCFSSYCADNVPSLAYTNAEIKMMTKMGGGTSGYLGEIRPRGSKISTGGHADGAVHFAKDFSTAIDLYKQSKTRRGACAVYLPIDHGDINEFLNIATDEHPIQNLQTGVTVPSDWLQEMRDGDYEKRVIWAKLLQTRSEIGFPYIFFTDNVNNHESTPEWYGYKQTKEKYEIKNSNLCSEITTPVNQDESFVCCLSSLNLYFYDDWKDTDLVKTVTIFLDTVMTEFINKANTTPFMKRAVKFAREHRSLGLGVLGYHSLLQKKMIPFESWDAKMLNNEIFKSISDQCTEASIMLAGIFGEPDLLIGTGHRNSTKMAIAPTKTSSAILGQISMGIEPLKSNYFIKDLAKIKMVFKNPELEQLLIRKGQNTEEVWESIKAYNGSVQHLEILDSDERAVFKTFEEISQLEIIQQAAQRQRYIDNSQSLNITIHPDTPAKDLNHLILTAHDLGVKTLYYQFSSNAAQNFSRELINGCSSCEG